MPSQYPKYTQWDANCAQVWWIVGSFRPVSFTHCITALFKLGL